jgi:hypothetical protein
MRLRAYLVYSVAAASSRRIVANNTRRSKAQWRRQLAAGAMSLDDLDFNLDCSLPDMSSRCGDINAFDNTELPTPEGSPQRGTDATQGAERPCSSSNPILYDPQSFSRNGGTPVVHEGNDALSNLA